MLNSAHAAAIAAVAGLAAGATAQTDIDWAGGTSNWNNAANWSPANVPNLATENARILSPAFAVVTGDVSASIGQLVIAPDLTLELQAVRTLFINGGIVNDGLIVLNPSVSGNDAVIRFDATGSISGTGTLRLAGGGNDARLLTNVSIITNELGHTIDGAGQISADLVNNGVITAADTGFGNRLELNSFIKTNNLTMEAASGAELFITTDIDQAPGATIGADAGGEVILAGNSTITGGRLVGPGPITRANSGSTTLSDVSLETDLNVGIVANIIYDSPAFNCSGRITLNDGTNTNNAAIRFDADTVVSGGGSIFLAGGDNDSLVQTDTDAGTTVTFAPGFTVEGSGQLLAQMVNNGLVRAFMSANNDGVLEIRDEMKINNGVMRADAGGALEFHTVSVVQNAEGGPDGVILADGGAVEFIGNPTVEGGTIRTINGGTASRLNSGTLTLTDTAIDGDLGVGVVATVAYNGDTLDCSGTITLNDSPSSNDGVLRFDTDSTITGGGRVFLGGSSNDSRVETNGTTLTVAPDFTIEGAGQITGAVVNNGLIRTALGDNANGTLSLIGSDKTNNATMAAETGGVLEINGITITQGAAGEILADGGAVEFIGNQTVSGGTIRTINGGTAFRANSGTLSLNSVAIDGDLSVGVIATVAWTGPVLDCNGSIILNDTSSSNNAIIRFDSDATATGGGRIFLGGSIDDSQVNTAASTFTIGSDFTVEGSGQVNAALVNEGLVRAFPSEFGNGRLTMQTEPKTNNGLMVADDGGVLEFLNATVVQNTEGSPSGVLLADEGGIVEFTGNGSVAGGVLDTVGSGRVIRTNSGTTTLTGVTNEGGLEIGAIATLAILGGLENNGTIAVNDTGSSSDGILRFDDSSTVTGSGVLSLRGGSNDSQINTNATTATFGPDQRIEGEGQMNGDFVVNGTMAPGLPIGDITGSATVAFGDSAVFETTTDAQGSGGRLALNSGSVDLDGRVEVMLSYVPALNDQFNIISAPTTIGLFDDVVVTVGSLPTNIAVRLVYAPGSVDVKFVCLADLAPPFGVLDLADVTGFTSAFLAHDPLADLAEPIGVFDLADINAFVTNFLSGCN